LDHSRKLELIRQKLLQVGKACEPNDRNRSCLVLDDIAKSTCCSMDQQPMVPTSNYRYLQLVHWKRLQKLRRMAVVVQWLDSLAVMADIGRWNFEVAADRVLEC
jgi:hypothetical protein